MTLAILFLLVAVALKALISFFPALSPVGTVLGWLLVLFLAPSVLVDLFRNIPGFLLTDHGVDVDHHIQNWKLRYVFFMGVSIFVRLLTVLLLVQWFLFPTVRIFGG
jgi:hypothetical protein